MIRFWLAAFVFLYAGLYSATAFADNQTEVDAIAVEWRDLFCGSDEALQVCYQESTDSKYSRIITKPKNRMDSKESYSTRIKLVSTMAGGYYASAYNKAENKLIVISIDHYCQTKIRIDTKEARGTEKKFEMQYMQKEFLDFINKRTANCSFPTE